MTYPVATNPVRRTECTLCSGRVEHIQGVAEHSTLAEVEQRDQRCVGQPQEEGSDD